MTEQENYTERLRQSLGRMRDLCMYLAWDTRPNLLPIQSVDVEFAKSCETWLKEIISRYEAKD